MMDAPAALKTIATGGCSSPIRLDLSRWQERPQPRHRDRLRAPGRRRTGRTGCRDADTRDVHRSDRAGWAARGEEHDAGSEAVRHGRSRSRDPGPLQHGGCVSSSRRATKAPTAHGSTPTSPSGTAWMGRLTGPRTRMAVTVDRTRSRGLPRRRLTKPYCEQGSFLEIELAARRGEAHRTCGGRALNDDVMDTIFTQLVNVGNGPVIRDGVDHASRPPRRCSRTWPTRSRPARDAGAH